MIKFIHATLLLASAISTYASPLHARSDEQPVLEKDFPDPALIQAGNGTWWSFATAGGGYNIQMASAPLPSGPWTYHEADALPQVGAWSTGSSVWAPDVRKIDSQYVMYYAAEQNGNGGSHCVAVATALDISGPYTAEAEPLSCNTSQGGSIDPSGFTDDDGSHWVTWKIDGNSIGNGGTCGNTVAPIVSTPIMLQRMSSSGITADGSEAIEILDRSQYDGPLIEAPVIIKVDGIYYLSFSSNCYSTPQYDVSYATASSVTGPYTKSSAPLLVTGDYGLTAPGGATAMSNGAGIVFHGNCDGVGGSGRCMFYRDLSINGDMITT